jgi:hypothetical protein
MTGRVGPRRYRYVACVGRVTRRYGQAVTVLAWHRSRVLVEFPDGCKALTPGRCPRRLQGEVV